MTEQDVRRSTLRRKLVGIMVESKSRLGGPLIVTRAVANRLEELGVTDGWVMTDTLSEGQHPADKKDDGE